jgi:FMN phosphatase YigB (HAD superfamily)
LALGIGPDPKMFQIARDNWRLSPSRVMP